MHAVPVLRVSRAPRTIPRPRACGNRQREIQDESYRGAQSGMNLPIEEKRPRQHELRAGGKYSTDVDLKTLG